jgi:hypothetical protein
MKCAFLKVPSDPPVGKKRKLGEVNDQPAVDVDQHI